MSYKRAEWHSGLTYRRPCGGCGCIVQYQDTSLDFRPWFPDGFVYCPKCQSPLRHNEKYAINAPGYYREPGETAAFCTKCGRKFNPGERFCANCGTKRN
ncbi:MAG: zinc ribbon domain-containing protein [Clostridia bacterium]|nr:zinc ribbon domain-containing protein [Clostridia bacterium]